MLCRGRCPGVVYVSSPLLAACILVRQAHDILPQLSAVSSLVHRSHQPCLCRAVELVSGGSAAGLSNFCACPATESKKTYDSTVVGSVSHDLDVCVSLMAGAPGYEVLLLFKYEDLSRVAYGRPSLGKDTHRHYSLAQSLCHLLLLLQLLLRLTDTEIRLSPSDLLRSPNFFPIKRRVGKMRLNSPSLET